MVTGKIVLCMRGENARAEKSQAVYEAGGLGMILYNTDDVSDLATDTHWVPSVHVDLTPGLAIKDYIATDPNPTARILRGRAGTWRAADHGGLLRAGPNPVAEDIIKPDITAPGMQILAGYSPYNDPVDSLFAAIQHVDVQPLYCRRLRPGQTGAPGLDARHGQVRHHDHGLPEGIGQRPRRPGRPVRHGPTSTRAGKVYNGWFAAAELDDEFTPNTAGLGYGLHRHRQHGVSVRAGPL